MHTDHELNANGFDIVENLYSSDEIAIIAHHINDTNTDKETFRKSVDLFAIRQFLKEVPAVIKPIFNDRLKALLKIHLGEHFFLIKSIYFDKPASSNWFVAYHQDLTISVDKKIETNCFGSWTKKQEQFSVQPPLYILKNILTIRIHLDETDENNGALKVIAGSHLKEIYRPETIDWTIEKETNCAVAKGGIMLMKPLLLHSSGRTTGNTKRRVIHLEFSSDALPAAFDWAERLNVC